MLTTTESLRHQNRAYVLAGLRELGPSAHTTLGEWSGLSSASVSAITAELLSEGVVERVEQVASSGRGRPRVLFGPRPGFAYLALVRITTESVEYSLVDYSGVLCDRFHEARLAKEKSVPSFLQRVRAGISKLLSRNALSSTDLSTITVTTKGVVDPVSPTLLWSPVFNDVNINFAEELKVFSTARVHVRNETTFTAQAIAQRMRQSEGEVLLGQRIAVLSLGHSIGLGVATLQSHSRIDAYAPPFGHMIDQRNGPLCRCGGLGCVEATAGFYGILRNAMGVPANTLPAPFVPLPEVDKLAMQARKGVRNAEYAFRAAGECLGLALSRLNSLLTVSDITITGYGTRFIDLLMPSIQEGLGQTMQAKQGRMPNVHIELEEAEFIHAGNMQWSLAKLDEHRVARRLMSNVQAIG